MATDILISDITNSTAVSNGISNGTGVFDKLMNTVNLYLNDQYTSGRLKGPDYANVLLGSIQSIIAQSMSYTLQEKVQEAQVDKINADITNAKIAQQTGLQTLNMAVIDRTNKKYTDKVSGITTYGQYTLSGDTLTYTPGNPA